MGALYDQLKPKYQRFCDKYVETGNLTASARHAGSEARNLSTAGRELIERDDISAAIAEIAAEMAVAASVTRETLTKEYALAYRVAIAQCNPSAMVSATTGKARLYGLDIQATSGDSNVHISLDEGMDPMFKSIIDYALPKPPPRS